MDLSWPLCYVLHSIASGMASLHKELSFIVDLKNNPMVAPEVLINKPFTISSSIVYSFLPLYYGELLSRAEETI
ncbi:hypothetical protein ENUP19_0138G0020 [Entamoeba nuttalli]|uniref:Protein kinase domain-containing protein n=1 Tax=Entamoeba nuttalli TaxID=412467 RepID=A0ABQ0DK35_9EUKA